MLKCILDSRFGGPHRRSYAIAERLRAEGIDKIFLFGHKGGEPAPPGAAGSYYLKHLQFMRRRHAVLHLLGFLLFLPWNLIRVRRILRSAGIDIADVDGVTNLVPALAAAWSRVPIVWHYNDHLPGPIERLILPLVARLSTAVVVQGEQLKQKRTGSRPRLHAKTVVIYPGVDTQKFDPDERKAGARRRVTEEWGVPLDGPLIGTIGNVNRFKGHVYFLRAAARIKQHIPTARFVLVGRKLETDLRCWEQLQQLTAELGLKNDVIYTGFRDDVPDVLAALDVFALCSIRESCPNVLLEAMAMRTPVVTTDVGAVGELVQPRETAFVVPAGDAEAIAEAVLACLNMPEDEVRRMTEAARKTVEDRFGIDTMARRQLHVYQSTRRASTPGAADLRFGPRWEGERNKER